jgi:SAM-dependent methyltransferase
MMIELEGIKQRQQQAWASGDYAAVGPRIVLVAEHLCDAADLRAGWRVLDVATGSGNAAIAAARLGCSVVGIDYVPALLERARMRAVVEGFDLELVEADTESLSFRDESFDAVFSVFGAMFTPNQARTAAEMLRVLRPGGTLALASWTPDGVIGELFRTVAAHVPPPAGLPSPMLWGTEVHLRELLDGVAGLTLERAHVHVQVPVRRGARLLLPDLVRAHAEGVRGPRRGRARRAGARSRGAREAVRPARCRRRGDPVQVHQGDRAQALSRSNSSRSRHGGHAPSSSSPSPRWRPSRSARARAPTHPARSSPPTARREGDDAHALGDALRPSSQRR